MTDRSSPRAYLVTGGSGFLGSALVHRLVADGQRVRVLDDDSRGRAARLADVPEVEIVRGDVRDPAAVLDAARGVDVVCHLAYVNGTRFFYEKPDLVLDVAVKGMVNVLDACRAADVRELLLVSSSEVYHDPPTVPTDERVPLTIPDVTNPRFSYAAGKLISEVMAINHGRHGFDRVVVVRPHNVYGADMGQEHVIPELVHRLRGLLDDPSDPIELPIQGTGEETRAFVHVDDFVDGLLVAMNRGEHLGIYHVGTQDEVTIRDLAERIGRTLGRRVVVVPSELRQGSPKRRCPNIQKISALGYRPRVTLDEGLARVVPWYVAQAAALEQPATGGVSS
jgi:dTDP-glucose 4,6-dehydratase/UDP-glucose 4-epimerase